MMKKFLPFLAGAIVLANAAFGQTDEEKARAANEARLAREAYGEVSGNKKMKKKTRVNLNENYIGYGLGYVMGLSENAPQKSGVNFHFVSGFPIVNNKLVLETQVNIDTKFGTNTTWYALAYNMPASSVDGFQFGMYDDITFGAYPVIVNKRNLTWTAGPLIGGALIMATSPMDVNNYNSEVYSPILGFTFCYGVKTAVYLGEHVAFSAQYTLTGLTEVETAYPAYPVSFGGLRLGVTFMRPSWW